MVTATPVRIDRRRVDRADPARAEEVSTTNTRKSGEMYERARRTMSGGVASSYQVRDPWPIYLERGRGSKVWDVDGNEMVDFHNGFGSMVQGHAHPAIVEAVQRAGRAGHPLRRAGRGRASSSARSSSRRFGLPQWRYVNSGSEATMDAIRIARASPAATRSSRSSALTTATTTTRWSRSPCRTRTSATRDNYASLPYGAGIPKAVSDLTIAVPFNDAGAMERRIQRLFDEGRPPACVIMEAAMMNLGVVLPEPGYLEAVREITRRYGIVLIFDEVKTGLCVAPGGATEKFGVLPDMVTMAKALGGGLPSGAIGGTEEVMEVVDDGKVYQVGTYNGNPLTMAAARASLEKVLTPDAYEHLDMLNDRLMAGCDARPREVQPPGLHRRHQLQGMRDIFTDQDHRLRLVPGEP